MQQYLPFTVLKRSDASLFYVYIPVATVLTVYGIETSKDISAVKKTLVATVLTVYGIETGFIGQQCHEAVDRCNSTYRLRY